jgi:hypothetical protein
MEHTPVKDDQHSPFMHLNESITVTPENGSGSRRINDSNNEELERDLIGHLSGMKLAEDRKDSTSSPTTAFFPFKRSLERLTVEGSPCVAIPLKKLDITPTPAKVSFDSHVVVTPAVETKSNFSHYPLLVFSSASDDHDTGNHQENALRTALLCGVEQGCLRRPLINSHIQWMDCEHLPVPPIADLLRVHDYEYLANLEKKCNPTKSNENNKSDYPFFYAGSGLLDTDTPLVEASFLAAKRFCRLLSVIVVSFLRCFVFPFF